MEIKAKHIIFGAAIIGFGYWLYRRFTTKISFGFPTITFDDISLTSAKVITKWPVTNDTGVTLSVDSFNGAIWQGDNKLTDVDINTPTVLQAGQTVELTSIQTVQFLTLAGSIVTAITAGTWANTMRLKGNIIVDGVPVPVNMDMNYLPI